MSLSSLVKFKYGSLYQITLLFATEPNSPGVFHFFAHSSAVAMVEEGGRRRKGLRQEYLELRRAVDCFWRISAVVVGAITAEG